MLLAKLFYERGCKTPLEIRNALKTWAKAHSFYFNVSMNSVAIKVIEEDMHLLEPVVYINDRDIEFINDNFDSYNEKFTALAVICYAKAYADDKQEFKISKSSLSEWIKFSKNSLSKYFKILEYMGLVSVVDSSDINSWYKTTVVSSLNKYVMGIEIDNSGDYELIGNDLTKLWADIYNKKKRDVNVVWHKIPGYNEWYSISDDMRVKVCSRIVGGRMYPEKELRPFYSKSKKKYFNLYDANKQKQVKVSAENLFNTAT